MVDIDRSRVLEVVKDRTTDSCDQLWSSLTESQKNGVSAVATDFWRAFSNSTHKHAPQAEIVHDHFHISQYLVEAVDLVRRRENKTLRKVGDDSLVGTRQLWLYNFDNLKDEQQERLDELHHCALQTARAWGIKEMFRGFWEYHSRSWAEKFFDRWYSWAIRSRLEPIKKVAVMLKKHLESLLAYFNHRITNAKSEGFNSRVQSLKSAARGFRSFENYRIRILFYCGKLDLMPKTTH
jgi:transposase